MEQSPTRKSRQSSKRYAAQIVIELHGSRRHRALILLVHLGAAGLLPWIDLPFACLAVTGLFIAGSLLFSLNASRSTGAALSLRKAGDLYLRTGDKAEWRKAVISSVFLANWLIVFKLSGRQKVICFPDSMGCDDFRRLTVFARLHGPASKQESNRD